ncbi:VIP peptides isoform X5 [Hylobates moloch]|uniref:VIP peptides isoform X5 n=1 Tax=Hylobates moloch TaxID=81572 RepID=UPI0026748BC9|nr:VIP peptides isoform X5 [Hylobates moloch]
MDTRNKAQLLVLLTLLSVLFSQTSAWPLYRAPSALRLGDTIPFEGANEPDQVSLKEDIDILQNALAENDTPYYDVSRNARHADGVFTSDFSKLLGQLSAKKYLESLMGKRVSNIYQAHGLRLFHNIILIDSRCTFFSSSNHLPICNQIEQDSIKPSRRDSID